MQFFGCVFILHFCSYCAFFLKLHVICTLYASSQILFGGDFLSIFYDNGEVVTSLILYILELLLGLMSVCSHHILYSRFLLLHLGTRGYICQGFCSAFTLLCSSFSSPLSGLCELKSSSNIIAAPGDHSYLRLGYRDSNI